MLDFIVGTMIFVIVVTACFGIFSRKIAAKNKGGNFLKGALKGNMVLMAVLVLTASVVLFSGVTISSDAAGEDTEISGQISSQSDSSAEGFAYLSAALSTGLATIGAGIAVAVAGSAALGAISEDSKLLGKTLIFVGLAEGIAIYGLIISIMILNKV